MAHEMNLIVTRGTTLKSGKVFSVEETLPSGITYEELMAGIVSEIYHVKPLTGKTYSGQVRDRANALMRGELVFDTTDNQLSFTVPAEVTKTWPNEDVTYFYDAHETVTLTGEVTRVMYGKIFVKASITKED